MRAIAQAAAACAGHNCPRKVSIEVEDDRILGAQSSSEIAEVLDEALNARGWAFAAGEVEVADGWVYLAGHWCPSCSRLFREYQRRVA